MINLNQYKFEMKWSICFSNNCESLGSMKEIENHTLK